MDLNFVGGLGWKVAATIVTAAALYYFFFPGRSRKVSSLSPSGRAPLSPPTAFSVDEALKLKSLEMKPFAWEEIVKHNSAASLWVVIQDKVYDVTTFAPEHPGQMEAILRWAGKDCTKQFFGDQHPDTVREMVGRFQVGFVQK